MKNNKINIKTITIIVLLGIIISLIFYILNMKNISIKKQEIIKEQLEANNSNSYVDMETHLSELSSKQQEINNMQNLSGQATVTAGQILKDYTVYKDGKLITGTMANNGAVTKTLNAGGSYTIPEGYHNGSGKVTANSLESQTQATATASDILSGKTAWVNGNLVTGNISATAEGSYKLTSLITGSGTDTYDTFIIIEFTYSNIEGYTKIEKLKANDNGIYSSERTSLVGYKSSGESVTIAGVNDVGVYDISDYTTIKMSYLYYTRDRYDLKLPNLLP